MYDTTFRTGLASTTGQSLAAHHFHIDHRRRPHPDPAVSRRSSRRRRRERGPAGRAAGGPRHDGQQPQQQDHQPGLRQRCGSSRSAGHGMTIPAAATPTSAGSTDAHGLNIFRTRPSGMIRVRADQGVRVAGHPEPGSAATAATPRRAALTMTSVLLLLGGMLVYAIGNVQDYQPRARADRRRSTGRSSSVRRLPTPTPSRSTSTTPPPPPGRSLACLPSAQFARVTVSNDPQHRHLGAS